MKKLLLVAMSAVLLAGCGGGGEASYSDKVLEDKDVLAWRVMGESTLSDGETKGNWDGDLELATMKATSVKAISEIDKGLADKLAKKSLKYLYMYENLHVGYDIGWNTKGKFDGEIVEKPGSHHVKACKVNEEAGVTVKAQWIYDPHTAYAEALTDNYFIPVWQEEEDADGFAWDKNSCVKEAGVYTFVVAQYTNESAVGNPGYGMAFVKTGELPEKAA